MNSQELKFSIFCIGGVAETLGMSAGKVYHLLKNSGILDNYIVPCYDVLHTFGEKYLVDDIISYMRQKGVIV